jgi:hypothetical protein
MVKEMWQRIGQMCKSDGLHKIYRRIADSSQAWIRLKMRRRVVCGSQASRRHGRASQIGFQGNIQKPRSLYERAVSHSRLES